jgi:enoyl-CoA hydratase/carnithine racemase
MTFQSDAPPQARLAIRRDGSVLHLTICNPALRNAMHPSMYREGATAVRAAAADPTIRVMVLSGQGEHFCGGGDLRRLAAQRGRPAEEQAANLDALHEWVTAIREAPQPVIAAVEGAAAGGGFSICLGCDLIVAAEDARFIMSYAAVGLSPDGGGSDALARMLPPQAALELLLDPVNCSPQRLHQWGVVNRIVPHGAAVAEAMAWAGRLATQPRSAQESIKRLVYDAALRSRREQLDAERDAFVHNLYQAECGEAIDAFLSKSRKR